MTKPDDLTQELVCTCPSYYANEDFALVDFCPVHGIEAKEAKYD